MQSPWSHILTPEQIEAYHALTASIDPRFARAERAEYAAMTAGQLRVAMSRAWLCNEACRYQLARSYLAMMESAAIAA